MSWILELIVIFHALLYREIISFQIMDSSDEENNVKRANRVSPIKLKIVDSSDDEIKDKGEKRENPIKVVSNSDGERKVVVSREEEINENDDEDDLLILNVNEADVEGMSIGEEEERDEEIEQHNPTDSEPAASVLSDRKAKKKKKHRKIKGSKSKKAKKDKDKSNNVKVKDNVTEEECQESGGLSPRFSSEDEEEKVHVEIKAKRRKLSSKKQKEKEKVALDFDCELSEDRTILTEGTVNSLGNYCPRMLAGLICQEKDCSWTHFMMPADAAGQFKKIINFR